MLKKYYFKFRKHLQNDIKQIVRSELVINTIRQKALSNKEALISNEIRKEKIIVSLTTHGIRINSVYLAIESIALQTLKPNEVVLWLSEAEFNNNNLPITLNRLIDRGLIVKFCKDVGPHTKLIYALKEYSNDIIITIDDDIIYPPDLIENLYTIYKANLNCICCNGAQMITYQKNKNHFEKYNNWPYVFDKYNKSKYLLPLGVHGILYPPNSLDKEVFNEDVFKIVCPKSDDIWFKAMALKQGTETVVTGKYPFLFSSFIPLDSSYIDALANLNILKGENLKQITLTFKKYNINL
ncbi:MAG: glycosyltransferase [Bacteroidales bacterium]|nr:glycosyltransferase [Bacteroidales bacterium]